MSDRKPAVVMLGGLAVAWNQRYLDAVRRCGMTALVIDRDGQHVRDLMRGHGDTGHPLAEVGEVATIAPDDHARIVDQVSAWAGRYDVRGVVCLSELYVLPAAFAADLVGVRSPGLRAATVCRDKYLQRRYLDRWSPDWHRVGPAERAAAIADWRSFPVVVKPTGRFASSGVRLAADADELAGIAGDYGPDETLLFESRVSGPEYSVESMSVGGSLTYVEITQKRTTEASSEFFVELGHTTPAVGLSDDQRTRLIGTHLAVLDRLAFDTGMAHGEYRLPDGGDPVLIEIAARPPGDSIMALHWLSTGTSLEEAYVHVALGEPVDLAEPTRVARQVYLDHPAGVLEDVTVADELGAAPHWFSPGHVHAQIDACGAPDDPATLRCVLALKPSGTPLAEIRESGDRAVMFVIDAASPAELDALEQRCRNGIKVRVGS